MSRCVVVCRGVSWCAVVVSSTNVHLTYKKKKRHGIGDLSFLTFASLAGPKGDVVTLPLSEDLEDQPAGVRVVDVQEYEGRLGRIRGRIRSRKDVRRSWRGHGRWAMMLLMLVCGTMMLCRIIVEMR